MKSRTSHGELRNAWVRAHATRRTAADGAICHSPSTTPPSVPMAMVRKLMRTFIRKPLVTRNGSHRQSASKACAIV